MKIIIPTKRRLLFVFFVALPIVTVSNCMEYFLMDSESETYKIIEDFLLNFSLVYFLALLFVPIAEVLVSRLNIN